MNQLGFSIIICCYNSAFRLPATLTHLAKLKQLPSFSWEVIVVDNCCDDNTAGVAAQVWRNLGTVYPLRVVHESKPGLNFARERGMREAAYEYILFCDDDNWLDSEYLVKAYEIMTCHPEVGILGGQGIAAPEIDPPVWFEKVKSAYAVGKKEDPEGLLEKRESFIAGAGMVLRKGAWVKIKEAGFQSFLSDRKGKELSSAGDLEFSYVVKMAGYKLYYSEELVFHHFIPKNRLTWKYIIKGCKGYGKAIVVIESYLFVLMENIQKPEDQKSFFTVGIIKNIFQSFLTATFEYLKIWIRNQKYTHEEIAFYIRFHQLITAAKSCLGKVNLLPELIFLKQSLKAKDESFATIS